MSHAHHRELKAEDVTIPAGHALAKLPVIGIVLAVIGGGATAALAGADLKQFYHSYLVAFLFFLSLGLGGLFFVLVQFATRSGWSVVVRRLAENLMATLPLSVFLFIPVALGAHDLFHWTHEDAVATDKLLQWKEPYLNIGFFYARAAAYLLIWTGLSLYFRARSTAQDRSGDHGITRHLQKVAPPGIALFALSLTFAAVDWIMTLDPHWYSTMFGVYYFAGSVVGMYALMSLMAVGLSKAGLLDGRVNVEHFHDLGKMLFAFTAFWTYIAFSQYFLIWYANIPEETLWFLHRWSGSWKYLTLTLGAGHFVIPFFFLLPRTIKRNTKTLSLAAVWMLTMHLLDIYWLVMPNLHKHGAHPSLLDLTCFLAVGGVFIAALGMLMRRAPLIPVKDPRLPESLSFENI